MLVAVLIFASSLSARGASIRACTDGVCGTVADSVNLLQSTHGKRRTCSSSSDGRRWANCEGCLYKDVCRTAGNSQKPPDESTCLSHGGHWCGAEVMDGAFIQKLHELADQHELNRDRAAIIADASASMASKSSVSLVKGASAEAAVKRVEAELDGASAEQVADDDYADPPAIDGFTYPGDTAKQAEQDEETEIVLDKSSGERLGIGVNADDGRTLLIRSVSDGDLIGAWINVEPDHQLKAGAHIVEINGVRGDAQRLLSEINKDQVLKLKVVHDRQAEQAQISRAKSAGGHEQAKLKAAKEAAGFTLLAPGGTGGGCRELLDNKPKEISRHQDVSLKDCEDLCDNAEDSACGAYSYCGTGLCAGWCSLHPKSVEYKYTSGFSNVQCFVKGESAQLL